MPTVYLTSPTDALSNDAITNVARVSGAPDGSLATFTPTEDTSVIAGEADLSAATTADVSIVVKHGRTSGSATPNLTIINLRDAIGGTVLLNYKDPGLSAVPTSVQEVTIALSGLTPGSGTLDLTTIQATRSLDVAWSGDGTSEVSIDSIAVTWEAGSSYSGRIASSRLSTDRLSGDRLSLSRL